ncbi:MAG: glutamate mutase L [Candidatus Bathyarchaeota archaeon]|nr:glutamate mutase L [Candidatus Bathyarchaeota archaeon]
MSHQGEEMSLILATDVGSTTTKARLFRYTEDSEWRYVISGEAPTTVEAPFEDVTLGVRNAVGEIEELTGLRLLSENGIITPRRNGDGVDLYVTTSSAGGGLQMTVAGVISTMTAESAERVALGAGAIVMDTLATDDGRRVFEQIERIRYLRPDMILLAGGTDGGTIRHVMKMAEVISSANPTPRLGRQFELPLVFAGNVDARDPITNFFGDQFALEIVENIRPELEMENPGPARDAIHKCFMEHVMSHAPGYGKLMKWTEVPIMPTPGAEGMMFQQLSRLYKENVLGVGLGGATTNVYSVFDDRFVRTVSANLGMSYSICNVLKETGIGNIVRWIPFKIEPAEVVNRLRNKMTRPTAIPQTLENLLIEHAVAREALRLGFAHHKFLAMPLRGVQVKGRDIGDMFKQFSFEETYLDMLRISWLGGTGGLLSHAPRRVQSALMLIDGFQVEGVTRLAQDSVFMMPHLGVLSTVQPKAALEIFEKDCLVRLGTCIAPRGSIDPMRESAIMSVKITTPDGTEIEEEMLSGTIKAIPLGEHQTAEVEIKPARGFDVGAGPGHSLMESVEGGVVGIILDARGRPVHIPEDEDARIEKLTGWFRALDAYPEKMLERGG